MPLITRTRATTTTIIATTVAKNTITSFKTGITTTTPTKKQIKQEQIQ